ncbi:MAG: hypothetical protein CVV64_06760 [Candidatus Wallbacteria bacterium HGW-Wallbacteria-1]|uniref:Prepilin-type N-terminal cleavage/methylation domain-containing protein n=1 Tax=Candidatus Wallbacteria bacterium HGW-Wallbacteria-1 TaxID=2013854 RepID=A0A2N1PSZ7_9BACT|nr:MAG: hypothetical protein CVV64_06760 [Candidatus Wallbacteria bacterium HGW-Wallbacteria-1]
MFTSFKARRCGKGFTIMEILIASAVLMVLFGAIYKIFTGVLTSFDSSQWKLHRQGEIKMASRLLKQKIAASSYPNVMKLTASNPDDNGLFMCSREYYTSFSGTGTAPPNYFSPGSGGPGLNECFRYVGDGGALSTNVVSDGECGDRTFSVIARTHTTDPFLIDKYKYPSINGKMYMAPGGTEVSPADNTSVYRDWTMTPPIMKSDSPYPFLEFLMCRPRKDIDAAAPENGLVGFQLYLIHSKLKDSDGADLWYREYDFLTSKVIRNAKVVQGVFKIEIAHRLVPNDPPIGDFVAGHSGTPGHQFQFFYLSGNQGTIQTESSFYQGNNPAQGLTANVKKYASLDMRRGSLVTLRIFCRPWRDSTFEKNILLVEEIEEKTNVRVVDDPNFTPIVP